jgi:SHS2 domain-containing protein
MFEIFPHTADLGLRVRAASLEELFVDAARGLFAVIVANPDQVQVRHVVTYDIEGEEHDYLLFDWLSELLFTFDAQRILLTQFEVQLDPRGLRAVARGEPVDPARHRLEHEVKAITYHGLKVEKQPDGWLAEVIVDI